jgi:hypothetical protein
MTPLRRKRPFARTAMEPRGPTLKRHAWPRQPIVGLAGNAVVHVRLLDIADAGSRQLIEQHLRVLQIGGAEALGEPAVNGREQLARLRPPALFAP